MLSSRRGRLRIRALGDKVRDEAKGKRNGRPFYKFTKKQLRTVAEVEEVLVPIRLEIDHEHWKLRDTFTWNTRELYITPEIFAINLCKDLILPPELFVPSIITAIKEQIDEHRLHEGFEGYIATATYSAEAEERSRTEEAWWAIWRSGRGFGRESNDTAMTKLNEPASPQVAIPDALPANHSEPVDHATWDALAGDIPLPLEGFPQSVDVRDDELRITIKLDIVYGNLNLTDRFEWDISDPANSPEIFADAYAQDLGLSGEFQTAIAHSIREQVDIYVRSLAIVGHQAGFLVPHDELRFSFLGTITDPFRGATDEYTPFINALTPEELDRHEKEHDRDVRRKRRQTRGRRAINLPDREPQRTARTTVPIQGRPPVVTYQDDNDETVTPAQPVAQPYPILELASASTPERQNGTASLAGDGLTDMYPGKRDTRNQDGAGTPMRGGANRISRRLRGVTVDDTNASTPLPEDFDSMAASPGASAAGLPNHKKAKKGRPTKEDLAAREAARIAALAGRPFDWGAAGLHDPMIDGVWHCSNCGCPEGIAIGRRKGAGGKDTLCGECGKYLHRYKKNRPTHYSTDPEYHLNLKQEAERAKQALVDEEVARKQKKREELAARKAAAKAQLLAVEELHGKADSAASSPAAPLASVTDEFDPVMDRRDRSRSRNRRRPAFNSSSSRKRDRSTSLSSSFSPSKEASPRLPKRSRSGSESSSDLSGMLLSESRKAKSKTPAVVVKVETESVPVVSKQQNCGQHDTSLSSTSTAGAPQPPPPPADGTDSSAATFKSVPLPPPPAPSAQQQPTSPSPKPPHWMLDLLARMREEYPNDRVELIPKMKKEDVNDMSKQQQQHQHVVVPVDWRLKCLDCPGKLYTVGPAETFQNFSVHLKNKMHRSKVDDRSRSSVG